jgi:serine/threonine protein kinase
MSDFAPSTIIKGLQDSYRVIARHAEGGFGITYRAARLSDQHPVLLKSLRLDRMRDWKAFDLFEREAKVMSQLSHPGIPKYHEFFSYDGASAHPSSALTEAPKGWSLLLVQDFISGKSLAEVITQQQRYTNEQAEALLRKLLSVLSYLHGLHPPVVHRDINPRNVIIAENGAPFLVDFGAIQERLRAGENAGSTSVGSFGYMPMEQAMGKAMPASDLYALGMTLVSTITHQDPSTLPIEEQTGKVNLQEAAPGLSPVLFVTLSAMLEPIIGKRIATAKGALDLLNGQPVVPPRRLIETTTSDSHAIRVNAPQTAAPLSRWESLQFSIFSVFMFGGMLAGVVLNMLLFNSLSESELVEFSYLWLPVIAFGFGGRFAIKSMKGKTPAVVALVSWMLAVGLLFFFFEGIFPAL